MSIRAGIVGVFKCIFVASRIGLEDLATRKTLSKSLKISDVYIISKVGGDQIYYDLPNDPTLAKPLLQRFMRENLSVEVNIATSRRRPQPVRNLAAVKSATQPQVTISWTGPQSMSGVVGFNIYQNNENNRIQNIANPLTLFAIVALAATGSKIAFFVSTYTALLESIKTQIIVQT